MATQEGLTDIVLSWSIDDILNENLFLDEVEEIPKSFDSLPHYLSSFVYPLLEETRAQLFSRMEIISTVPFAEVDELRCISEEKNSFYVKVDYWRNGSNDGIFKEPYKTLPGDVLILADDKPETVSYLKMAGRMWSFALVTKIPEDDEENIELASTHFEVIGASKDLKSNTLLKKSLFAVFLVNITTNKRIWNALHAPQNRNIISEVLCTNSIVKEECTFCIKRSDMVNDILDASLGDLNESQNEAVFRCLHKTQCPHRSSIELIWGPPGTGKTKTLSTLLFYLLTMKRRVLVCAPTNVAITEVAARVLKLFKESLRRESSKEIPFFPLGEFLLFGNMERLKMDSDVEEIHLDHRVKMIAECVAPETGWLCHITSMIDVLEEGVGQYHVFVENELNKKRGFKDGVDGFSKETDSYASLTVPFLEFLKDKYESVGMLLKKCLSMLCTHFSMFISERNVQQIISVLTLLDSFTMLLLSNNFNSLHLEEVFSCRQVISGSADPLDPLWMLSLKRQECVCALESLRDSLRNVDFPDSKWRDSIVEACFGFASLIFCTASSSYKLKTASTSYKLKTLGMKPMELVVVDEAAQLKECESVIPLQLLGLKHAILVGDECQLPAMVESRVSNGAGFGRSLFERLSELGHSRHLLNVQYRMHPSISLFPNSKFYSNQIVDAQNVKSERYTQYYLPGPMFGPYSFIDVSGGREEKGDDGRSIRNLAEVAVVLKIVSNLYRAWKDKQENFTVGIISPYAAQVAVIQQKLPKKYQLSDGFTVKVKSVDGFQGGEEDVTIVSTVRSNISGLIGFLSSYKRMNVSITRARHCLWILGDANTFIHSKSAWQDLIRDAKKRCCFFSASDDKELVKALLDVKKEYDQLDDLLNGSSTVFRNASWKVHFSENFRKSFCNLSTKGMKMLVMSFLVKLSDGWRPKHTNVDIISESTSIAVKKFKVEDLFVLCTTDIVKEERYIQVLKIWDVLPLEDIAKVVKHVDAVYKTYTDEYISLCRQKCLQGDLEIPKTWDATFDIVRYRSLHEAQARSSSIVETSDPSFFVENTKVSESMLLMKFYSLSEDTVSYLLSDHDGRELTLPFEVTDQEKEIIMFPKSTFILGRSGTGKTTVLTMKLLRKEQLHHRAVGTLLDVGTCSCSESSNVEVREGANNHVLRQLFVTVSPKLSFAVKQHIMQLKSFVSGGKIAAESSSVKVDDIDDTAHFENIPDLFIGISPQSYPLVITFQKFVMMLDATVGISYFERFSDLRELCIGKTRNSKSVTFQMWTREKQVNYDKFIAGYWPHFSDKLTRKIDPSRVFTEIMSYIKGGLQAGDVVNGRLSRPAYVSLSQGRASTLREENREKVYNIFLDYEKMKTKKGEFDLADLVNDLHLRLQQEKYRGDRMDFVYIDEVQDLTMRQIALFKYVCTNVEEGFVFSGDTAQTIARGIDFRFEDIRNLFYMEFLSETTLASDCKKEKGKLSKIFHLNQNFRTHDGILKMAQSVVGLLYHFFPLLIDALSPEMSFICGEAPILLEAGNDENAIISIFDGNNQGNFVGFGAEQVIIVRDDCIRKEVLNYVKRQALVLTIVESKGLEFQDVLLYNFFGSSPLKHQWRVLYEYMKEQNLCDVDVPCPAFDEAKHNILCSELKQLYVAITRTRQRLWISENPQDFAIPMFDYWKKSCLVHVRRIDNDLAKSMQHTSSPEEWKSQGFKLLRVGNYEMATMCFERAGYTYGEKLAKATGLRAEADTEKFSNFEVSCGYYNQAAEIFLSIGKAETAAECFYISKEYKKAGALFDSVGKAESAAECFYCLEDYETAGRIYFEKCGKSAFERAARCFDLAQRYDLAAEVYAKSNNFSKCLSICAERKFFEMGLQFIKGWKKYLTNGDQSIQSKELQKIEQSFLESCASHYHECKDTKSMMECVKSFQSMDAIRTFLKHLGYLDELLSLEEGMCNFLEAANIARMKGDILLQADLLSKQGHFKESAMCILWYVLYYSLWAPGSKGWPLNDFEQKEELIAKAMSLSVLVPCPFYEHVCIEVSILSNKEKDLAELSCHLTASRTHGSLRGEMLCTRKILDAHLHCQISEFMCDDDLVLNLAEHSEKQISENRFCFESLIHFWDIWREIIVKIIKCVKCLENKAVHDFRLLEEFSFNYLGVLRQHDSLQEIYLLNPDAAWVGNMRDKIRQSHGKLFSLEACNYVMAAQRYWGSELISVSMKVLRKLDAFYKFCVANHASDLIHMRSLIYIYEMARSLLDLPFLHLSAQENRTLADYIVFSTENYFSFIFPHDWRKSLRDSVIYLRGKEISRRLLKERFKKFDSGKKSYGEMGCLAVTILGSSTLDRISSDKVIKCFKENSAWKALFENFHLNITSVPVSSASVQSKEQVEFSLIWVLHEALQDAFNANWRKAHDYISPVCFMYLLERILILSCFFKGNFFVTQSSFVEWLVTNIGNTMHCTGSEVNLQALDGVLSFVADVVQQLLFNKQDTMDWITKSKIEMKHYYPLLVLKLVLIVCILHVNFEKCSDLLFNLLQGHPISNWLPPDFLVTLRKGKTHGKLNMSLVVLAEAMQKAKDPLVIVSLQGDCSNLSIPDAIFVDMSLNKSKEGILKDIFPNIIGIPEQQSQSVYNSSAVQQSKNEAVLENSEIFPSALKIPSAASEDLDYKNKMVMVLWRGLDALGLFCSVKDVRKLASAAPLIKEYLDPCIIYLNSKFIDYDNAEVNPPRENYVEDTGKQALGDLLKDMKQLSEELSTGQSKLDENISSIREISERLQSRKSLVEPFLNQMLLGQDPCPVPLEEKQKKGNGNSKGKKKRGKKR